MRLKRLDIAGFKSFVDPTKVELHEGMTAIVGPNGCGKSNIVDAIRWVLGEHSARQLRGGVMQDLIFQGSDTRSPVGICDVELTFTVQRGKLSPPYHESDEIRIRRRLIRDGGSDAFINGKMVRMKDIVDLFLDTGVSTRAYAIVEQGSIARMITAKPEERRQLLEEAAGVMKYRARRKEAEQKMKSTQQNLERVHDLLEEVRSQCRSLKQQASRAERFKTMQDELEQAQLKALALRYCHQQELQAQMQKDWQTAQSLFEGKEAEHQQAERLVAQLRRSTVLHDEEVQLAQDELRQREQQLAQLQQQAERLSGERRLLQERQEMLEIRISETTMRCQHLDEDLKLVHEQLHAQTDAELQTERESCAEQLAMTQENLYQAREQRDESLRSYEQLRSQFQAMEQQQISIEKNVQRLDERELRLQQQQSDAASREEEHQQQVHEAEQQHQQAMLLQESSRYALESGQLQWQQLRDQQQQAMQLRKDAEKSVRALRGEMQELEAQLAHHPLSDDVRDLLRTWGAIWVDEDLPSVPEGLELAVAAALRGHEGDAALPKQVTLADWQEHAEAMLQHPMAIHLSATQVESDVAGLRLVDALGLQAKDSLFAVFAHVQLCESIFAASPPKQGCVVSRDGWRLEPDGWLIPPAKNQMARRLVQQRRLQACEEGLEAAETALSQREAELEQVTSMLEMQQQQNQNHQEDANQAKHEGKAAQAWLQRLKDEAGNLDQRQQQWQHDWDAMQQEKGQWQMQRDHLDQLDHHALHAAEQRLEMKNMAQQQYEQQWQHARSALAHADQAMALYQQTRASLERDGKRMQQELAQLQQRQAADQLQLEATQRKASEQQAHADLDMQLLMAQEAANFSHQSLQQLRQQGFDLQEKQRGQERQAHDANKALQDAGQARLRIEMKQATEEVRQQELELEMVQRGDCAVVDFMAAYDDLAAVDLTELLHHCGALEQSLARFGPVNLLAIDEFKQASEREQFLTDQSSDLESSLTTLSDTIARIDRTTRQRFREVFDQTNAYFKEIFPKLFGGGRAELKLDSDDVLTAGVEVIAQPPGKRLQDMTLLSGGEKALTAVALVFSIFRINPAPFCILDEVDAPLDDANVVRFSDMITEFSSEVQFLAISHNKITMKKANRLIGVSMPEAGVSKIVTVDLEEIPD